MAAMLLLLAGAVPVLAIAQTVPLRHATEVFRYGGPDAEEPYAFSQAPRLVVDSAETIYARVASEGIILVFGPDGRFVRSIGRKGEGPGEFQIAGAHGLIGDTLWVTNWPTPRMSLFRKDGSHLSTRRTWVASDRRQATHEGMWRLLRAGRALVFVDPLVPVRTAGRPRLPLLIGTRNMQNVDTLALIPNPRGLFVAGVGSWSFAPMPSSPLVATSSAGAAIAIAEWDRSRPEVVTLRVVAPDGTERLRRKLELPSRAIPKKVRDSLLDAGVEKARPQLEAARRRGADLGASNERLVEQGLDLPDRYPPVRKIVIGIDGSLWLERFGEGRRGDWLVLGDRGEPLFQVQLAPTFEVQQASATDVWGTDRDELDVSYLVRLRLTHR